MVSSIIARSFGLALHLLPTESIPQLRRKWGAGRLEWRQGGQRTADLEDFHHRPDCFQLKPRSAANQSSHAITETGGPVNKFSRDLMFESRRHGLWLICLAGFALLALNAASSRSAR
jgi:hypothetical protein